MKGNNFIIISGIVMTLLCHSANLPAQDTIPHNLHAGGYLTNMQSFMFQTWKGNWISDNLIHNRLNFKWQNNSNTFNTVLEVRNRFIWGESMKYLPGYPDLIESDAGYIKLTKNISSGSSYLLNTRIDRLYFDYTFNKLQVRLGRQRINWGQCYTWNPNDLFNTYSFFDFDYVEKPGCDAVRLMYYPSTTSNLEFAIKADSGKRITTAFLYRFNKWNYDIQFLGGFYNGKDYVIGAGWSGSIQKASIRGEVSYFRPKTNFADTTGTFVLSLGSEYTFSNSLTLQGELLYNQLKKTTQNSFLDFYNMDLSAKQLSFTDLSLMIQISYPLTPLINGSISAMYFPNIKGYFAGPSVTCSISDNIDFSFLAQSFGGKLINGVMQYYHLVFLRLKWNF